MKNYLFCLFAVLFFFSLATAALPQATDQNKIILGQNWKLQRVSDKAYYPATVPGCVHTDLLNAGKIKDPFWRTNELDLQWIDKEDWEYSCTFDVKKSFLENQNIELVFEGLDTYADVSLNGGKILSADNMFRTWRCDLKKLLKEGENKLSVYFHSPVKVDLPKYDKMPYTLPAINDLSEIGGLGNKQISVFARKAPYHYGWDWGPRFVTSGIWRPVYLEAWNTLRIQSVQIIPQSVTPQLAALRAILEVQADAPATADFSLTINDSPATSRIVHLQAGTQRVVVSFEVKNPDLWWPNGLGAQPMYAIKCVLKSGNISVSNEVKYGIRDIKVIRDPDTTGRSFYFKVNDIPVFMKGADYIPCDIFLPRVTEKDYETIVKAAHDANMNMLRVWGGGIYENDVFYNLCDKYGILVWQDCMFACSMYPGDEAFQENVRLEMIDNVKRLRNHASIALWAGNNEMEDAWNYWGWKKPFTDAQQAEIYRAYTDLFHTIIPDVIQQYDGTRFYWPSCPSSDFGRPSNSESGDIHDWDVWHGKKPFENYQIKKGRFFSEYGFQSFPDFYSVKKYSIESDWDIESAVMKSHQRSGIGNLRIRDYLEMYYKSPKDFENFLYVSQVLQAFGIKQAIEAHRRAKPYTMGTIFWQIDDCWPVASWSSLDYYKRWKALHYIALKAFVPVLCAPVLKNDTVTVSIINDLPKAINGELQIVVSDFNGKQINSFQAPAVVDKLGNSVVWARPENNILGNAKKQSAYAVISLKENGKVLSENILYFVYPKDMLLRKPEITSTIEETGDGYLLKLSTNNLAKDVFVDIQDECQLSDNYFDLLPGSQKIITIKTGITKKQLIEKMKIHSLVDSY